MPTPIPETNLTEVADALITVVARQAAILKLIRMLGSASGAVSGDKIREILQEADERIRTVPVAQEVLAKKRLPPPESLASILKSFPWDV